jgi:hypothetical protein
VSRGARKRLETWLHLTKCAGWAHREFISPGGDTLLNRASTFLVGLGRVWTFGGTRSALYRIKKTRELFLFVLAHPDSSRKTNQAKRRLRRLLGPLAVVDRPNEDAFVNVRFCLTVLTLMRGVRVPPTLDTGPITSPSTGSVGSGWVGYLSGFWDSLRSLTRRVDAPVEWKAYHLTNKRGPGGGQAILGWFRDLSSLPASLVRSLEVLGGASFTEALRYLLTNREGLITLFGDPGVGPIRKVVAIQDAEGKSRVIAMIDYFSQTVLRPLHQYLFRILSRIPQDVTFDQGSFLDRVSS